MPVDKQTNTLQPSTTKLQNILLALEPARLGRPTIIAETNNRSLVAALLAHLKAFKGLRAASIQL